MDGKISPAWNPDVSNQKEAQWLEFRRLLTDRAATLLEEARTLSPPERTFRMKSAVDDLASFAETTIDLLLELYEGDAERRHRLGDRAKELQASGALRHDSSQSLDHPTPFRNHAMYRSEVEELLVHGP